METQRVGLVARGIAIIYAIGMLAAATVLILGAAHRDHEVATNAAISLLCIGVTAMIHALAWGGTVGRVDRHRRSVDGLDASMGLQLAEIRDRLDALERRTAQADELAPIVADINTRIGPGLRLVPAARSGLNR